MKFSVNVDWEDAEEFVRAVLIDSIEMIREDTSKHPEDIVDNRKNVAVLEMALRYFSSQSQWNEYINADLSS